MADAATLSGARPTRKDEAWRYSAVEALGDVPLDDWRTIDVGPGETFRDAFAIEGHGTDVRRLRIRVGEGATCELFGVIAGGDYARVEVEVTLARGSHFELGGVTVGGRETVREFVTHVVHAEPEATSNQVIRAVHWGQGTGNFLGRIDCVRDAQKTDAAQDFKGLLLEKGASVNAVPQLEIFADDVKCAHGATVGQLDEAARFYMAARGLSPELARKLLVRAFLGDAFVALDDEAESERLMDLALSKLDAHL
ncbi:SufD family Fe-S cluster assembly protein [Alteriqipengyuania flavescens]|uniref:SufD family Fe-S cluster assembly protein n=1 Tax=Alteriqipengyuania flavescens TaxID=3053610 RepID=UPI0025B29493|nr:SufD family Fe-S cluster assembly protein [Alteriqipengyuania flavescens]WJY19639.1 SufD family Fe-S cluster assembly protein [Alteriqipengyuania flavescens]WJY25579.1 SufD family Fe-S cluster assembly protein [Alteriqipengyuania flavescens]